MKDLARQRCFNHPHREAAARCPECGRFYCRECITEHEDRVLCASCLARLTQAGRRRGRRLGALARLLQTFIGLWIIWLFFYYLGRVLITIPASFHEGALWKEPWW
ncbi:MAG: rhomboid family protein [Thermodesulfobacteriota bacterium]